MKKALLIAIFSLMALVPFDDTLAQAGSNTPAVKGVAKSSPGVVSSAGDATAKNQTTAPTLIGSTEVVSSVLPKAASEAQRIYNSGVAFHDLGRLNEAIRAFKEAIKLKPNDPQTHYMLGMSYWNVKSYNDAVDSFQRAGRLKPDWAEAHFRLGLTYYVVGRKTQANAAYHKLLELNSPLAPKLYRVIADANTPKIVENRKAKTSASTTKQIDAVPVSASAANAPLSEKPRVKASESNSSSTNAASPNKAIPAVAPPNERPSPAVSESSNAPSTAEPPNKAIPAVEPPNEKPSPAVKELSVPATAISSDAATATATTPAKRIASADPAFSNNAKAADDAPLTDIYKVGVGDVLDIRLLNSTGNRSTLYTVIEGGVIDFPIAGGPIPVAGLTATDIQERITSELKRLAVEERSQIAVGVRQYASHTVIITGLVNSPGTKILRREAVPLYVLLAEVQPRADAARASIMRAGARTQVLELSDSAELNVIIRPGDVINVSARPQEFYFIGGRISYPGQKTFQPGITLIQAILAAGGIARDNVVELSREGPGGRLVTTKLSLKEIKSGKIEDPRLQPGDRVEVLH